MEWHGEIALSLCHRSPGDGDYFHWPPGVAWFACPPARPADKSLGHLDQLTDLEMTEAGVLVCREWLIRLLAFVRWSPSDINPHDIRECGG